MTTTPQPRLIVMRDGQVRREIGIPLEGELVIGRTTQCSLVIDDPSVSRMHARVFRDQDGVFLEDLGSVNGTSIDGRRIDGIVRLLEGQMVRAGQHSKERPLLVRFTEQLPIPATTAPIPEAVIQEQIDSGRSNSDGSDEPGDVAVATAPVAVPSQTSDHRHHTPAEGLVPDGPGEADAGDPIGSSLGDQSPVTGEPSTAEEDARELPVRVPAAAIGGVGRARAWHPRQLALAAGLLAVLVAAFFAIRVALRPPPPPKTWTNATLLGDVLGPGERLVIRSPAIQPDLRLESRLGDEVLAGQELIEGELALPVPDFGLAPGPHERRLTVVDRGVVVFDHPVVYRSPPRLGRIDPEVAPPGALVRIEGVGFGLVEDPRVLVGGEPATIVGSTDAEIVFRVPPLPAPSAGGLEVTLEGAGRPIRTPMPLQLLPVDLNPVSLSLEAASIDDRSWAVSTPWGRAFTLGARRSSTEEGEVPPEVQQTLRAFDEIVAGAEQDELMAIKAVAQRGGYRLEARGDESREPIVLVVLPTADLDALAKERSLDTTPHLLAAWQATAWNGFLDLFARGRVDAATAQESDLFIVLDRLAEHNRLAGGNGRPAQYDLEALSPAERDALAHAFVDPGAGYRALDGHWTITLENVFHPRQVFEATIAVDLDQRGHRLSGTADPSVREKALIYQVAGSAIRGEVIPDSPPRVRLAVELDRPVGRLELDGSIGSGRMEGTFTSSMGARRGTWTAELSDRR